MIGKLAPAARTKEQWLAVFPLTGLPVEVAGGGGNREVRDRQPVLGVAQFWISREVTHDGNGRFASHDRYASESSESAGAIAASAGSTGVATVAVFSAAADTAFTRSDADLAAALRAARSSRSFVCAASCAIASSARSTFVRMTVSDRLS